MIDVYTWPTPNGHKIHIMLEECGLPYTVHPIDIRAGDQLHAAFIAISPNNKIPAIVDQDGPGHEPLALMESGAILIYLADKAQRFLPTAPADRYRAIEWTLWQVGGFGPMLGQAHHFLNYAPERIPYAMDRYSKETNRLYRVLDTRLGRAPYLAGDDYSIADMATWPWVRSHRNHQIALEQFPNVGRWYAAIGERPAVQRAVKVLAERRQTAPHTKEQFEVLFGSRQYESR